MKPINATHTDPTVMCNVRRKRKRYDGQRQDLTRDEIDKLFAALRHRRNGHRDYMIGLVCFLHGLRVSELIDLRWDDIDWRAGTIRIRRLKGSLDGVHILERDEAAGLRRLQREQEPKRPHVFTSERGQAFTRFAINKMIEAAARRAGLRPPASALPTSHHGLSTGQWRHERVASAEAPRACEHEQHDRLCADVARAAEGYVAREALARRAAGLRGRCADTSGT
jgi:integrase